MNSFKQPILSNHEKDALGLGINQPGKNEERIRGRGEVLNPGLGLLVT